MSMAAAVVLKISTNSSLPPAGPRNRNSLITTGVATMPTPVSATVADDPPVVETVSVAARGPPAIGANVVVTVVVAPGASVVAPGAPAEKRAASAPPIEGAVNTIGAALTLVTVTGCVAVEATGTSPKSTVGGFAAMTIGGGAIATLNDPLPVQPFTAVACTSKANVPVVVGVPVSAPLPASTSPGGGAPLAIANVYGASPPDAVTAAV